MQQTAKMFRNCPYSEEADLLCKNCPQYKDCMAEKERRRAKALENKLERTEKKLANTRLCAIGATLLSIVLVVVMILTITANAGTTPNITDEPEGTKYTADVAPTTTTGTNKTEAPTTTPTTTVTTKEEPKVSADGPSDDYYYNFTYEEKVAMAKVVYAEAGGECFEGKVAVAAVIINRFYSKVPYFQKDTIIEVMNQPYQFASTKHVTMEKLEANPDCMEAVEAACKGWDPTRATFSEGALYFYAPKGVSPSYQAGVEVQVIGNHNFHFDYKS